MTHPPLWRRVLGALTVPVVVAVVLACDAVPVLAREWWRQR